VVPKRWEHWGLDQNPSSIGCIADPLCEMTKIIEPELIACEIGTRLNEPPNAASHDSDGQHKVPSRSLLGTRNRVFGGGETDRESGPSCEPCQFPPTGRWTSRTHNPQQEEREGRGSGQETSEDKWPVIRSDLRVNLCLGSALEKQRPSDGQSENRQGCDRSRRTSEDLIRRRG
jgi:hypothetical protein